MTVPVHVHCDSHPNIIAGIDADPYEEWMNYGPIYNLWTYQNAISQGGLIDPTQSSDPLKYLFYPTAQIANFFCSKDFDGNNTWCATAQNGLEPFTYTWEIKYVDGGGYLQNFASVKAEKEKKDKEKKKDGDIIIALAPSNEWVPLYVNSDLFTRPHNPTDLHDYYLKCSVTDASGTTKTSNEWFVVVTADPPPVNPPQTNTLSADDLKSEMNALSKETEITETPNVYSIEQN